MAKEQRSLIAGSFLRVRNLDRYQHYHDRNPPWIKLHSAILENYDFAQMPDAMKAHALLIVILASRMDNKIPNDPAWIGNKIGARSPVSMAGLAAAGFVELINEDGDRVSAPPTNAEPARADAALRSEVDWRIDEVWQAHLKQRNGFFLDLNGVKPSSDPTLTAEIREAIRESLRVHDSNMIAADKRDEWAKRSKTRAAGIGLFLDPFMTAQDKDNDRKNGGRFYLEAWRPWRKQRGKADPVDRFAALYFERKDLYAAA